MFNLMKYTIHRSRRAKRIILKVEYPAEVIVTTPRLVSLKKIDRFVESQETWIKKQLAKIAKKTSDIESATHLQIFGKIYQKNYQYQPNLSVGIHIQNSSILLNFPKKTDSKLIKKELALFLKKAARTYLQTQTTQLAATMQVTFNHLTFRNQKTRWGSCSSDNNISLNWRLVHYEPELINYVIIHELAHLSHHNHSQRFWALVAKYDSTYKYHQQLLKKQGVMFS